MYISLNLEDLFKHLDTRPRLLISIVLSGLAYVLVPPWILLSTKLVISWDAGVFCFLTLALTMMNGASSQKMRRSSQRQDENRWTILILVVGYDVCLALRAPLLSR